MAIRIEKAAGVGFCFGVKRAVTLLEEAAAKYGSVETLTAPVHNQPVLKRLEEEGVRVVASLDEVKGKRIAIGAHGVSPEVESLMKARRLEIIDTTCPFVHRAQLAAKALSNAGFFTIIFGESEHPEIKSVLGWAKGQGIAVLDIKALKKLKELPRRLGVLSQTTQIPDAFSAFVKKLIGLALVKDSELRIIDTICHDIRDRQASALKIARQVDLMLVIGGHTSANSHYLAELCGKVVRTYLVETVEEIDPRWLKGEPRVGITSGASTDERTIDEVIRRLSELNGA